MGKLFINNSVMEVYRIWEDVYKRQEQGIASEKVKPEFPKTDEPSEQEMKVYKIYSFLCKMCIRDRYDRPFHVRCIHRQEDWFPAMYTTGLYGNP